MKEIFNKINKYGISGILDYFINNVIKTYWYNIHYLKINLNYKQLSNQLGDFGFNVKELNYNDFLLGDPNEFTTKKLKIIKERLYDNSYRCYGFIDNNILAYSTWISLKKIGLPIVKESVNLSQNEGFLEDSYCHPKYRGKGLHSKFNLYRMIKIHELGKKKCLVFVFKGNIPALKVQQKFGFYDVGYFKVGKILGFSFSTLNKNKMDKLFEQYNK